MIGQIIGNYKIESKLGEGGMGAVYKGVDTMLDREVAIKALRPELASQTAIVERFRSEAVTLAKLHHPNIATLYSLFRQTDELYMVMEYVKGETLDSILQRRGALPSSEVIPVFCQILDGINHAHEFGIVHRDIKPANMMLTEKGTLKVLDFGIARLLGSSRMTRAGSIIGTLEYMAPEQVKGQETDARTDIYALGMMLYEVLTGRTPFITDNEFELMMLQTEAMPQNPRSINSSIPEEVEAAIMSSIQKNPEHRFQTAGAFREALLDAGFVAEGSMRRITGPRSSQVNTNGAPFVSNPGTGEQTASLPNIIKETRLGAAGAVSQPGTEAKETRLGESVSTAPFETMSSEPSPSFFDNLNWIHYAGAGGSAAIVFGLLIIIPVFIFSGTTTTTPAPANVLQAKPAVAPTVENKPQKAEVVSAPAAAAPPIVSQQPAPEEVREPLVTTPISGMTNISRTPAAPSDETRSAGTTKKTSTKPPPPTKKSPPTRRDTGSRQREIERARCQLTGNC